MAVWIIGAGVFLAALLGGLYLRSRYARTRPGGQASGTSEQPSGGHDEVEERQ